MPIKNILLAPDSYKGCLTARQVCLAMEAGIHEVDKNINVVSFAASDGGEGFCDCMYDLFGGEYIEREVTFPDWSRGRATYLYVAETHTAYIELAAASGLTLVDDERRSPMNTTTLGTGELIKDAINIGAKKIVVGLGGSATNDGGMGILQALGMVFYDLDGNAVPPCGESLCRVARVDKSGMISLVGIELTAACDVKNPLCGQNGAAYVFARQKCANDSEIEILDKGLSHFADIAGIDKNADGAGAAGGCGGALISLLGGKFVSGASIMAESKSFKVALKECNLVLTGEGSTDAQTAGGKLISVVASVAFKENKPAVVISGSACDYEALYSIGVTACFSVIPSPMSLNDAIRFAESNIKRTTADVLRTINAYNS